MLTPEQHEFFDKHGWLLVGPLFGPERMSELRRALKRRLSSWAGDIDASLEDYLDVVSQWTNIWEQDPVFRAQLHAPRVAEIAAALIGAQAVRVFHDHVIVKPPQGGKTIPWHRDLPNLPIREVRAVSCWLALDDVTAESGAMCFMPGAHKEPMTTSLDFLNESKDWGDRASDAVPVAVPAGWAIFHHCLSWHTSPPNHTDQWRRAYITICMDADCTYAPERAAWHPMASRVTVAPGQVFNDDVFPVLGSEGWPHMMNIVMYNSSSDLRGGLHRVLSLLILDPGASEETPWWQRLPVELQDDASHGRLSLSALQVAFSSSHDALSRTFEALGIELPDRSCIESSFKRAVISGRAHKAHGGRDVYGSSNKALWDLIVEPAGRVISARWGETVAADGVLFGPDGTLPSDAQTLMKSLVDYRTGPQDGGHAECVAWLRVQLEALGFEVRLHQQSGSPPVIEANRAAHGARGHVMLYGHYDTVGASPKWSTDPDSLTQVDSRWFARGVADNKGPLGARMWALGTLERAPRLTWFIQGEEETGSRFARSVLSQRVPLYSPDLYLDETGYFDSGTGTLRLLARRVQGEVDAPLKEWMDGMRLLAARYGVASRFEERGLNKTIVAGGCPFDQALPSGSRVMAVGINDSTSGIHGVDESIPGWAVTLHRDQLSMLFHSVSRSAPS